MAITLDIDQFYSTEFGRNFMHLVQQSDGRVWGKATQISVTGRRKLIPQIGKSKARLITTRTGETVASDPILAKRVLSLKAYDEVYLEDEWDEALLGEVSSPRSAVVQSHNFAFQRAMDEAVIDAAIGTAYQGEEGETGVALPSTQIVGVQFGTSPAANIGLTLKKLIEIKSKFGKNEARGERPCLVISQDQMDNLLEDAQIASADFNKVKALYDGDMESFMGMDFIVTELLPKTTAGVRTCFAFVPSGLAFSSNGFGNKFSIRDDRNEALQVRTKGRFGATRLEEEKVVTCLCDETV